MQKRRVYLYLLKMWGLHLWFALGLPITLTGSFCFLLSALRNEKSLLRGSQDPCPAQRWLSTLLVGPGPSVVCLTKLLSLRGYRCVKCRIAIACTKILPGRNLGVTLTATSSFEQTQTEQEVPQSFSNLALRPIPSPIQEQVFWCYLRKLYSSGI